MKSRTEKVLLNKSFLDVYGTISQSIQFQCIKCGIYRGLVVDCLHLLCYTLIISEFVRLLFRFSKKLFEKKLRKIRFIISKRFIITKFWNSMLTMRYFSQFLLIQQILYTENRFTKDLLGKEIQRMMRWRVVSIDCKYCFWI